MKNKNSLDKNFYFNKFQMEYDICDQVNNKAIQKICDLFNYT
jgi:hypothetical protein